MNKYTFSSKTFLLATLLFVPVIDIHVEPKSCVVSNVLGKARSEPSQEISVENLGETVDCIDFTLFGIDAISGD